MQSAFDLNQVRFVFPHVVRIMILGLLALVLGQAALHGQQSNASPLPGPAPNPVPGQIPGSSSTSQPSPVAKAPVADPLRADWPNLKRFQAEDAALSAPAPGERRVVFMGDSITQGWKGNGVPADPPNPQHDYVNRGISGQTTPQMLIRFRQDVIDLRPAVVVILAGVNDIAGNTGDMTEEQTEDNLASMAELAQANDIRVVLCSIMPAFDFPWKPGREPALKIVAINSWIKAYAASHGHAYVDFYSAMVDERGGLPKTLSDDGVHPTKAGYEIMNPLVDAGIAKALAGN
jgi:lysophospholipase L1-like esterase